MMVSLPFAQTSPSFSNQSIKSESTAISLNGIKSVKTKNATQIAKSKQLNPFEQVLKQSTTPPNKPENAKVKTATKPSQAETPTFNAIVQSQLVPVLATPTTEGDPEQNQPVAEEHPLSQEDAQLLSLQTLQPEIIKPSILTDSDAPHAENQRSKTNNEPHSEASLSNENTPNQQENQQSTHSSKSDSDETPLLARITTSESALPSEVQQVLQPVASIDASAEVSVKDVASVVEQVGGKLEAVLTNGAGNKQVNIVLQPEALGTVRVQLQQGANQSVSGKIIVQTPEAFTALTQQLDGLKSRLEGQGISLQKLDVVLAPAVDNIVLDSQQQLALLDVSTGSDAFTQQDGQPDSGFNNNTQEEPEAFSMDKYRQSSGENGAKEEGGKANQQERKEAYQAHMNELRGLRSYRSALRGSSSSSQYA
ncbi:MAG: flagellar hook-length control protein FliK [Vampirovibrio sp.]|nr:flagellar hook-length control protein FliK [Vampirovibrio sp.]